MFHIPGKCSVSLKRRHANAFLHVDKKYIVQQRETYKVVVNSRE